eukprot:TRINITY_DN2797_c0_g1_i1.p1 TRINITY_DN2797_c0_g1~~TRINITY_DN2797_c0_g1_i1.p1  ORF type:complete len:288 (+),score=63.14 TRINITY_DN2797_c0_g1_i1:633-1496(+)
MCSLYEVVAFTASLEDYGRLVLDELDPERKICYRLFRGSCSLVRGGVVKNLARLGRDLKDVVIVDNSPSSYALQPCNGIPIKTWRDDENDTELQKLTPVLELLTKADDVRDYLRELVIDDKIDYDDAIRMLRSIRSTMSADLEVYMSAAVVSREAAKGESKKGKVKQSQSSKNVHGSLVSREKCQRRTDEENSCIILIDPSVPPTANPLKTEEENERNLNRLALAPKDLNRPDPKHSSQPQVKVHKNAQEKESNSLSDENRRVLSVDGKKRQEDCINRIVKYVTSVQ